jgi:hypothetical protein
MEKLYQNLEKENKMKHRKFITILLSLAIMVTFMPTMAFATVTWDDEYKTPTSNLTSAGVQKAKYTWSDGVSGRIKVQSVWAGTATYGETAGFDDTDNGTKYFYDLDGAKLTADGGKAIATTLTVSQYQNLFGKLEVTLTQPSYTVETGKTAGKSERITADANGVFRLGAFTFTPDSNYDSAVTTDQDVTISFKKSTNVKSGIGDDGCEDVLGDLPVIKVTVKADAKKIEQAKFYFDGQDSTKVGLTVGTWGNKDFGSTPYTVPYDGAAHTLVMTPVEGYSVAWSVFNASTGHYDSVNEVSITDVASKDVSVKATVTKAATATTKAETYAYTFNTNITPQKGATFGFVSDTEMKYAVKEGTEYDPYDFIEVEVPAASDKTDAAKAYRAAVKANEALFKEFFKAYYGVTAVPAKLDANNITFVIGEYSDKVKTGKEVDKKFEQLLANFKTTAKDGFDVDSYTHWFEIVPAEEWCEIEFTQSPTSKVFSGKSTIKKGKLKKNKSFTVKATSSNGVAVVYKLINAPEKITIDKNTGKITCKKGLKKGTYKITVKAYVPKTFYNNVENNIFPQELHNIKIVVKKK